MHMFMYFVTDVGIESVFIRFRFSGIYSSAILMTFCIIRSQ
jgi:hypothetical protein